MHQKQQNSCFRTISLSSKTCYNFSSKTRTLFSKKNFFASNHNFLSSSECKIAVKLSVFGMEWLLHIIVDILFPLHTNSHSVWNWNDLSVIFLQLIDRCWRSAWGGMTRWLQASRMEFSRKMPIFTPGKLGSDTNHRELRRE